MNIKKYNKNRIKIVSAEAEHSHNNCELYSRGQKSCVASNPSVSPRHLRFEQTEHQTRRWHI